MPLTERSQSLPPMLDILLGGKHVLVKINATPEVVRKEEADSLYTLLEN